VIFDKSSKTMIKLCTVLHLFVFMCLDVSYCNAFDKKNTKERLEMCVKFLADRTNGRAYATVLRLSSVCRLSVTLKYCG